MSVCTRVCLCAHDHANALTYLLVHSGSLWGLFENVQWEYCGGQLYVSLRIMITSSFSSFGSSTAEVFVPSAYMDEWMHFQVELPIAGS